MYNKLALILLLFFTTPVYTQSLHDAARKGDLSLVKSLVEGGSYVNAKNDNGNTPLHVAISGEIVEYLVGNGADVNAKNWYGMTPLHVAISGEIVEYLVGNGADVNAKNRYGWTPLHVAADEGHKEVVKSLVEGGADVNAKNDNGWTPLHVAADRGRKEIVKSLVEGGADVNAKNDNGWTLLHWAASRRDKEIVKSLVEGGADVNAKNWYGMTPLHVAISGEIVEYLVGNGADVNIKDNGSTPLHEAAERGRKEVVKSLVEGGADVNIKDNDGRTPLHLAANGEIKTYLFYKQYGLVVLFVIVLFSLIGFHPKIIRFAITTKNGLLLRIYSPFNRAILNEKYHYLPLAVSSNNVDTVRYLLKLGCNPHILNSDGKTLLELALDNPEMIKCLLEYSTPDSEGQTWLHKVVAKGDFEQVKSLVSLGADINAQDKNGRSPLSLALEGEHSDIVKYLVEAGANIEIKNEKINPNHLVFAIKEKDNTLAFLLIDKLGISGICSQNIPWLYYAVLNNNKEVLEHLLKLGCNPYTLNPDGKTVLELAMDNPLMVDSILKLSKPDSDGETWIHKALHQENIKLVQFLIDKGANIIARNKKGQRPVELAAELRLGKIGVLLVNAGGMGE